MNFDDAGHDLPECELRSSVNSLFSQGVNDVELLGEASNHLKYQTATDAQALIDQLHAFVQAGELIREVPPLSI